MTTAQTFDHPFNNAGVAPFSFAGYAERLYYPVKWADGSPNTAYPPMAGGTCAHCGTAIRGAYIIRDASGKEFDVGSQCVEKLSVEPKVISAAMAKKRQVDRQKRHAKAATDLQSLKPDFDAAKEGLCKLPHPYAYFAEQGRTLWDYYDYLIQPRNSDVTNAKYMRAAIKAVSPKTEGK